MSIDTHAVDPARLAYGEWNHRLERTVGEGDIRASYSADRIGMGQPLRKPFAWRGALWVAVSSRGPANALNIEAYSLTHPAAFDGPTGTYAEITRDGDAARANPMGFYHGMMVRSGGAAYVLSGPPVLFVPGQKEQLSLF